MFRELYFCWEIILSQGISQHKYKFRDMKEESSLFVHAYHKDHKIDWETLNLSSGKKKMKIFFCFLRDYELVRLMMPLKKDLEASIVCVCVCVDGND